MLAAAAIAASSSINGTWEGQVNDLPAVELVIRHDGEAISGSIGFYFQTRGDDGKWRAGEKTTLPLLSPNLEGKTLTFETIHHKKHGGPELGPNNRYQVDFVDANEARFRILNVASQAGEAGLKLVRRQ
jgi:hypothetical protein